MPIFEAELSCATSRHRHKGYLEEEDYQPWYGYKNINGLCYMRLHEKVYEHPWQTTRYLSLQADDNITLFC